jgi:hypothetical protein
MNEELFCSIYVDTNLSREAMAAVVVDLTSGAILRGGVDCPWARVGFDDDYGDFEIRQRDPDDFLGWAMLLEVMPTDHAERSEVVCGVTSLMNALLERGMRVLAQSDYADEVPGRGEVAFPRARADSGRGRWDCRDSQV